MYFHLLDYGYFHFGGPAVAASFFTAILHGRDVCSPSQDLETEIFLHLLQRNAADAGGERAATSASAGHAGRQAPLRCAGAV